MAFENWSRRYKPIMIWGGIIASAVAVLVWVSMKSKNLSEVASWVQAIGSVAAILGVWWQTKTQIAVEVTRRRDEEASKAAATLRRSSYLLQCVRAVCSEIQKFHVNAEEQKRLHASVVSQHQAIQTSTFTNESDFLKPNYDQYHQALSSVFVLFEGFPYWEIEDTEIAIGFISINQSSRICLLVLKHDPAHFLETMKRFLNEMDETIGHIERRASVSAS